MVGIDFFQGRILWCLLPNLERSFDRKLSVIVRFTATRNWPFFWQGSVQFTCLSFTLTSLSAVGPPLTRLDVFFLYCQRLKSPGPCEPGGPWSPGNPSLPRGPIGSGDPWEPLNPRSPLGPTGPRIPLIPGGPGGPAGPVILLMFLI